MAVHWRQWWPYAKLALAVAILVAVGLNFWRSLQQLEEHAVTVRWPWLVAGGLTYLVGLSFWGAFWQKLLRSVDEKPSVLVTLRTYFMGHLGKYVPGKAWNLLMRTGLMYEAGVRPAVGALTAAYEALTAMAAGMLLAALLFLTLGIALPAGNIWWGWGIGVLVLLVVIPILPGVFNPMMQTVGRLASRVAQRFGNQEVAALPRITAATFQAGLLITAVGWCWLGLSLVCVVTAVSPAEPAFDLRTWGRYTAYVAISYVVGFMAIFLPAGLGVREYLLKAALLGELEKQVGPGAGEPLAAVVALVLRLLWTAAEVIMAGIVYWLPVPRTPADPEVVCLRSASKPTEDMPPA